MFLRPFHLTYVKVCGGRVVLRERAVEISTMTRAGSSNALHQLLETSSAVTARMSIVISPPEAASAEHVAPPYVTNWCTSGTASDVIAEVKHVERQMS